MKDNFVELVLTCGSWQEAQKIADHLLGQRLVACVEMVEVQSKCIKLIMESIADNFDKVESEVAKLQSYKTFVQQMLPTVKLSKGAQTWIQEVIK